MTDKESQIDEILVLKSIYNDEEFRSEEENGLISGQFNVFLELPPKFSVVYRDLDCDDESITRNVHVAHLPPISLLFKLPADYPSKSPPSFHLRCMWLSSSMINNLVTELNSLWSQNEGMVILYTWTHFLKEESLTFLGISDNLDITQKYTYEEKKNLKGGVNIEDSDHVPSSIVIEDNNKSKNEEHDTACDDKTSNTSSGAINSESRNFSEKMSKPDGGTLELTGYRKNETVTKTLKQVSVHKVEKDEVKRFNKVNGSYVNSFKDNRNSRTSDRNSFVHKSLVFSNSNLPKNTRTNKVFISRNTGRSSRIIPSTSGRPDSVKSNIIGETGCNVPLVTKLCNTNNNNNNNPQKNNSSDSYIPIPVNNRLDDIQNINDSGSKTTSETLKIIEESKECEVKLVPPVNQDRKQKRLRTHILDYLIKYDEDRAKTEFGRNIFSCNICFEDKLGIKCTQFMPCKHVYCRECIADYFDVRIKEGFVTSMPCPQEKCKSEATQQQIRDLVGPAKFARYDSLLLSATLSTMADITYCPRTACQSPVMRDSDEKLAACPACQYVFCVYCKMTYHGVEPCRFKEEEKKALINQYTNGDAECQKRLEARYGKRQIINMINLAMSEDWITVNSKPCPNCSSAIEKSDGCNKMVCWKCNAFFCWLCSRVLDPLCPYKHFYDTSSKCYNLLFEGAEDALNREMEELEGDD